MQIRRQMLGDRPPNYSEYTCYTGIANFTPPDIDTVGYRVFLGNRQYFVSSDVGDGMMQWYAFKHSPEGECPGSSHDGYDRHSTRCCWAWYYQLSTSKPLQCMQLLSVQEPLEAACKRMCANASKKLASHEVHCTRILVWPNMGMMRCQTYFGFMLCWQGLSKPCANEPDLLDPAAGVRICQLWTSTYRMLHCIFPMLSLACCSKQRHSAWLWFAWYLGFAGGSDAPGTQKRRLLDIFSGWTDMVTDLIK